MAAALRGTSFDAVVDVSGMAARQVRTASELLADRVRRILLISTVSVHPGFPGGEVSEDSPVVAADPDDPSEPDLARHAAQKAGGELAAQRAFGSDRTLILRPGIILGPGENVGRINYWAARGAGGEPFPAPGDRGRAFQVADSRDLADWGLRALTAGRSGPYLAVAPHGRDTFGSFINAVTAGGSGAEPRWVPLPLPQAGVAPSAGIPMRLPGDPGSIRTRRIEVAGYRARPLSEIVPDSFAWWVAHPSRARPGRGGGPISPRLEAELLRRLA